MSKVSIWSCASFAHFNMIVLHVKGKHVVLRSGFEGKRNGRGKFTLWLSKAVENDIVEHPAAKVLLHLLHNFISLVLILWIQNECPSFNFSRIELIERDVVPIDDVISNWRFRIEHVGDNSNLLALVGPIIISRTSSVIRAMIFHSGDVASFRLFW